LTGPGGTGPDVGGPASSLGYNLISNPSGSSGWVSTDLQNVSPLLAPLDNYGGRTQTMALLPGSPAIGAGSDSVSGVTLPNTDQRGDPRTTDGAVDIGAFQSRGFTIAVSSGNSQSATVNTAFAAPLVALVSSSHGEPVEGGVVTFTAPASAASATFTGRTLVASINGSGLADMNVSATTIAGEPYVVTAATSGALRGVHFHLTNMPGAPFKLDIHTEPAAMATAGKALDPEPVDYIEDQYGNLETSDNTTQVTASLATGTGPLQGTTTLTVTSGIAAFTNLADDKSETISLAFNTNTGLPTVTSSDIVVNPGPPASLVIAHRLGRHPIYIKSRGTTQLVALALEVVDQFGNLETDDSTTRVTASVKSRAVALRGTKKATATGGIVEFRNLSLAPGRIKAGEHNHSDGKGVIRGSFRILYKSGRLETETGNISVVLLHPPRGLPR
jgi:hypothetical protein